MTNRPIKAAARRAVYDEEIAQCLPDVLLPLWVGGAAGHETNQRRPGVIAKSGLVAIGLMAVWLLALERRATETGDAVSYNHQNDFSTR